MVVCDSTKSVANINTGAALQCEGKCTFSSSYNTTYIDKIENVKEVYLSFSIKQNQPGTVKYNSTSYTPTEVRVYQPSLHTYNKSTRADAEVIVVHKSTAGHLMYLCSPLTIGVNANKIDGIIAQCAARAPSCGSVALHEMIDIGEFVHNNPFYTYVGECGTRYIVYAPPTTAMYSKSSHNVLTDILHDRKLSATVQRPIEVNPRGPMAAASGGTDLYIKCSPTGESGETISTPFPGGSIYSLDHMKNYSWLFTSFIAAIIMIVLWAAFGRLMRAVFGPSSMQTGATGPPPSS